MKSFAKITRGLTKMASDLETYQAEQETANEKDAEQIKKIQAKCAIRKTEAGKAQNTAKKLRDLIG